MEYQILGRHRESKDGGALITLARVGELAVQADALDWCVIEIVHLHGADLLIHPSYTKRDRDLENHPFGHEVVYRVRGAESHARCSIESETSTKRRAFW
jgi:hypothetical protein